MPLPLSIDRLFARPFPVLRRWLRLVRARADRRARWLERPAGAWMTRCARAGYGARGLVYLLTGVLAAWAAFGGEARAGGTRTIVAAAEGFHLGVLPAGYAFAAAFALGLLGFAVWRFVQASARAIRHRPGLCVAYASSGVLYTLLFGQALVILATDAAANGPGYSSGTMLDLPGGRLIALATGAGLVGYGLYQLAMVRRSASLATLADLHAIDVLRGPHAVAVQRLARAGDAARGLVFGVLGGALLEAAWATDPTTPLGLAEAFSRLDHGPLGAVLLPLVAVGLVAYGLFQLVLARFRTIRA